MTMRSRSRSAGDKTRAGQKSAADRAVPGEKAKAPSATNFETRTVVGVLAAMDVGGYVEEVLPDDEGAALKGWAFDRGNPDLRVALSVEIDGRAVAGFLCDLDRPDLSAGGIPRPDCGFLWRLPTALADGKPHGFALRAANGSTLPLLQPEAAYAGLWARPGERQAKTTPRSVPEPEVVTPAEPARKPRPAAPAVPQSRLFDAAYYLEQNADALHKGETAWEHFLRIGASERRNPNRLFDVAYYLEANPSLEDLAENPLLHFEREGRQAGLRHHWLFNETEYLRLNPDLPRDMDGLAHMIEHGFAENRRPALLFDPAYYFSHSPDVGSAGIPALAHFLKSGDREGRAPHPLFDPAFYARQAGPLDGMGRLEHYLRTNSPDSPHPLFDPDHYRTANSVETSGTPALMHYVATGAARGYNPHVLFDTVHYLRISPEPEARANPLAHYVTVGQPAGRSPHALFDPKFYAAQPARRSWNGHVLPRSGPVISVIVPVYNTPARVLAECIDSVLAQTYASWELCIVDDGSRSPGTAATLAAYRDRDPRIRIDRTTTNLHIARATNRAAMQASGEFLAFLDHDDVLEPDALAEVAAALEQYPDIDLLYTDEDKLDENGNRTEPYYKPDWSPDHLNSVMYVLHMLTVRKSLFWAVGGSRPERTGAQDFDLALRVARQARRVHHIPRILYHWRMMAGSAAGEVEAKPYAIEAGRAALQDAAEASGVKAEIVPGLLTGTFRIPAQAFAAPAGQPADPDP